MTEPSPRIHFVPAVLAVAVHVAIGAQFLSVREPAGRTRVTIPSKMLVLDMIPLSKVTTTDPDSEVMADRSPNFGDRTAGIRPKELITSLPRTTGSDTVSPMLTLPAVGTVAMASRSEPGISLTEFQHVLLTHIERFRRYPAKARQAGTQGVTVLNFAMDRDGAVTDAWVDGSSGSVMLDAEALAAIQRAQPLPPIPPNLPDRLSIVVPIAFTLD